jgi:translocation and assembly module TamB
VKWLKRGALALLGLALLAVAAGAAVLFVVGSQPGTAWLVQRLVAGTPQLSIERIRGTLLDGLLLEGIRLRTGRDELDIDSLALDWSPPALLAGTLAFEHADASRAVYRRVPGVTASGAGPPELPWPVRLEAASIAALTVTINERTVALDATRFAATYGGRRLELERVATTVGSAAFAADATFDLGDGIELAIEGEWSAPLAGVAANGTMTLSGTWPELRLHHELAAPFTAATDGTIELAGAVRVDLVTDWQALTWPGVATVASPSGRLALTGTLDEYRYDGSGVLEIAGRDASFSGEGTGARLELAVRQLELTTPTPQGGGTLRAEGAVSLANRSAELALAVDELDPAWLAPAWPGRLDGTAELQAAMMPRPNATLSAVALRGTLRGYPVTLGGAAAFPEPGSVRLEALRLESGANYVVLTGALDRAGLELSVDAQLEQLDLLVPEVGGALTGTLTVGGSWREPHGQGRLNLRNLAFAGVTLERFDATGELGLAAAAPLRLTIEAAGAARGPLRVDDLRAVVDGTTAQHATRIDAAAEDWSATLAATGGLDADVWRGTVERLDIDEQILGPWRLESPTSVALGRSSATLATSCLLHVSRARWCTELDLRGRPEDRLVVSGQNFDLATLRPLLPPTLTVDGVYQLSGSLFDLMGDPRGALAITGGRTRARIELGEQQAFATELEQVRAGMTLTAGRLDLAADLRATEGGSAEVRAEIADVNTRDSAVNGELRVEWPDLGFLALLSPELEQVAGALAVDLAVAGTVDEPTVDGRAAWSNGSIAIPRWGLVVDAIEATATSGDGRALDIAATGHAGEGVLTLSGMTQLDPEAGWPTRLTLRGEEVRIVQRADAEIFATPDLAIDVALPTVGVTGRVHVPRASLKLETLPAQAVTPSADAVVHGETRVSRAQPLQLRTAIELTLGDEVRYAGLNLDTTVAGELRLTTEPNRSAAATGTLRLGGTYDAYGQRLELERGQLLFSGPLDDPGLDVRAVRKLDALDPVEVGVELTGTLRAPITRIVSTPAMSEADALSYLLFGRPASGGNAGLGTEETTMLQTAALSLGLQQALPVVQRLGNTLGLDELTVQSTTQDAGELMAGKYLSPKLYIRYSYGLFNRLGGLLLRFKVNERLSIETRSGDQKSMDLLYTVEKD